MIATLNKNSIKSLLLILSLLFPDYSFGEYSWLTQPKLISEDDFDIRQSKLVNLPNGDVLNIWISKFSTPSGSRLGLKAARFRNGSWEIPQVIDQSLLIANGDNGDLMVSSDGNGRVAIAWIYSNNYVCATLKYVEYQNGVWTNVDSTADYEINCGQGFLYPQLATNKDGSSLLVWTSEKGIISSIHSASGWSKRTIINETANAEVSISSRGNSRYDVFWAVNNLSGPDFSSGIYMAEYDGISWSSRLLGTESFSFPCLAYSDPKSVENSDGTIVTTWLHQTCLAPDRRKTDIYYIAFNDGGWSTPKVALSLNDNDFVDGYYLAGGVEQGNGTISFLGLIARSIPGSGGGFTQEILLSDKDTSGWGVGQVIQSGSAKIGGYLISDPVMAENLDGSRVIIWKETGLEGNIYSKSMNSSWMSDATNIGSYMFNLGTVIRPSAAGVGNSGFMATWATSSGVFSNIYAPVPIKNYQLVVNGSAGGSVSSSPEAIMCGSKCTASFTDGEIVSLNQSASDGYVFSGWGGSCSGMGACVLTMDGDKSVTVNFSEAPKHSVFVKRPSTGLISSNPSGIMCGGKNKQCVGSFSYGTLTATPNSGYGFIKWIGCPTAQGSECSIGPSRNMTIQAVFKKLPKYTMKITKDKLGSIASSPAGLKCPDSKKTCTAKFAKGTEVTLTPVPQPGRSFGGWSGACSGTDPCKLLLDGNKNVQANFQ